MTGKKHTERERIQPGLLNYPEVQLGVTSRQLSSVLPTKVFLSSWGLSGWPAQVRGPDGRPERGNKNIKPLRPLNQTKNTSAVKGTVVHSGRLQ